MDYLLAVFGFLIILTGGREARVQERGVNQLLDFQEIKVCIGTNGRMSVPSNRDHHYRNLRDRYTNCTYVDGNLELTWFQDDNLDLSFLENIREVTGYVLISHVDVNKIVLPKLQIIRGRTLFRMNDDVEEFALMITLSKMYHLEMPALRDVIKGNVGVFNNYNLCHIKTINWKEIMSDPTAKDRYVYNFASQERECGPCHQDCIAGCWGEGKENCQQFSKEYCSPQCSLGRCFGKQPRECCHLFCAGGCTGPTQSDCIACKNFYDNGVCVQECPSMQIYNPTTYAWDKNPNGKYAYGATCVKRCPEHLLTDNGACVRACPPKKKAVNGECVNCDGPCPKTCPGDVVVHSRNINDFKGCTVIEGYIHILENSIQGYQHVYANYTFGERYPPMHPNLLEAFSSVKEITGHLNIQANHPDFRNLSYFRNLEVIGGRTLFEQGAALYIVKSSLYSLELRSLRHINMGSVTIVENEHLCFAENINWTKIQRTSEQPLVLQANSNRTACKKNGLVCDDQCSKDGCWGVGSDQCLQCANFKFEDQCLENCRVLPRIYHAENNTCKPCHEECGNSCYGPGANNCTSCKNFKDGAYCVPRCQDNKYEENGVCKECHSTCFNGCTGPSKTVGTGGCNSCEVAILYAESSGSSPVCLHKNDSCPDGYYLEFVGPQAHDKEYLRLLSGKALCRKCHPRCKKCTGYGFHQLICQECVNYKRGEQCEDECPTDHYAEAETNECKQCHEECRGCHGPSDRDCNTCQNYRIYDDGDMAPNGTFKCVSSCPAEFPHRRFPENSDSYCSDQEPAIPGSLTTQKSNDIIIIAICVVFGFLILIAIIVFVFYYLRKEKMKENAFKMTMAMTGLGDNEPLQPSNVLPNVAKLRIIKETELRKGERLGYGAFGTVFKGVWILDGENPVKIPVAIKVLREDTGANLSKEFLSEAYIMASVDHPNLLQLLAVCMASEMMLITQLMSHGCLLDFVRKNHDKIGSKALLNWCTQIARGMAYLEEKRLVHRDLAARNVLVQSPACVKITDFGLAKLLDTNEEEYKAAGGKMPIKWLALECIQHRIFTHKSDVWAFGVTVWELLTFGGRPYDNVSARDVPELLEKGERLPQPPIASIDIYMLMIKCWMLDAESRPCFKELEDDFCKMSRDPGRYLAIPGDTFMRLQNYTNTNDRDSIVRNLASALDSPDILEGEEYLQPKSRAPISCASPCISQDSYKWQNPPQLTSDGASSMYHNTQNNLNNKLLRYGQNSNMSPSECTTSNSLKDIGSDEYDSGRSQAQVGTLKLELPVDEDDYLMPSPQQAQGTSYLDLIDSNKQSTTYQDFYKNNIENPEYLMNGDQAVGLPTVSEFVQSNSEAPFRSIKLSEEESDHEYYNDFDRLQREMQPLQRNHKSGALV